MVNGAAAEMSARRVAQANVGTATAALVLCAVLWSLNGPLIKLLDQAHVSGWTIACYRSLLGGLAFLPLAVRRAPALRRVSWRWPLATVLIFTVMTASFVIANTRTAAANAIILQYTSAIWVFLLAPLLLHERIAWRDGAVLLVAMLGVVIIFVGNLNTDVVGLLIGLLSGLGYGALTVALRALRTVDAVVVTALNALGSGVLLLWPVAWWGQFALTPSQAALLAILALVQFTGPYLLFAWALQRIEAHRAALIVLLETIVNPVLTYLFVGEVPGPATFIGGPLICLSVAAWLVQGWRSARRLPPVTAPS